MKGKVDRLARGLREAELSKDIHYVYVAGKCDDGNPKQQENNVKYAAQVGFELAEKGYIPFVPHLAIGGLVELGMPRSRALLIDLLWLMRCDAMMCISSSRGTNREARVARALGIPVFTSVDKIPVTCGLDLIHSQIVNEERNEQVSA